MGVRSRPIELSAQMRAILEAWVRGRKTEQQLSERAQIILMSADALPNREQAVRLRVDTQRIRRWRNRWADAAEALCTAQEAGATDKELAALARSALGDSYRSGTPPKFSAEQAAAIIQLACEDPAESSLPLSHWTPPELAKEAARRGIVESISPRHVDRILKRGCAAAPQDAVLAQSENR